MIVEQFNSINLPSCSCALPVNLDNTNIDCLGAVLSYYSCPNLLLVFCCCLATVLRLVFVMDAVEDSLVLPLALCNNPKALSKSLALETP
jgi:hypothetical protein